MGSLPEVFGFVAQTLSQKGIILDYYFLIWDKVWPTKPKTSGNEPKGIGNDDLCYVSQIFLPKMMGNDTMPCSFVYVIVPYVSEISNNYGYNDIGLLQLKIYLIKQSINLL